MPVFSVPGGVAGLAPALTGGGCPGEWGHSPVVEPQLSAPLQVVSGCLSGTVTVWDISMGKSMMEFSVTGDQHVELTATALEESEQCLLTGLRDGAVEMWNYSPGKCLLTFPHPDKLEVSLVHQLGPGGRLRSKAQLL
ncbi:hypothetical protein mRhiFer1_009240 [Rhinolophus ferrumequinum]|uniref:Uncharacterized protein n=1 Tax=Rhinolophus ferrumequinum TaxID=59479 RepID=A0A7J7S7X7_RHIFE|nr:hypothetical protein mRhiFer1_009240 [Rhinolophus ferrumequinum]